MRFILTRIGNGHLFSHPAGSEKVDHIVDELVFTDGLLPIDRIIKVTCNGLVPTYTSILLETQTENIKVIVGEGFNQVMGKIEAAQMRANR